MIRYHGTDFNGSDQPILAVQGRHAMVSYARPAQLPEVAEMAQSFALDNGAFSAWRHEKPFDLEGCAEWITLWHRHPGCDWYLLPDVIDGDHHDNAKMRATWFKRVSSDVWSMGVPVWHLHEPLSVLQEFLSWPGRRIALGSSGEYSEPGTPGWWTRMAEAMKVICDEEGRPRVKLHGLRMLDPTIFSHLPLSSADSTNASRNIGIDSRWTGAYSPSSRRMRALILMERIEAHAAAYRWNGATAGVQQNLDLIG